MGISKLRSINSNPNWMYSRLYQEILKYKHQNIESTKENIDQFQRERTYIRQALSALIPDEPTPINLMADCLSDMHRSIVFANEVEREREPYWHIYDKPSLLTQWKKAEYYLDNALIFKVIAS